MCKILFRCVTRPLQLQHQVFLIGSVPIDYKIDRTLIFSAFLAKIFKLSLFQWELLPCTFGFLCALGVINSPI